MKYNEKRMAKLIKNVKEKLKNIFAKDADLLEADYSDLYVDGGPFTDTDEESSNQDNLSDKLRHAILNTDVGDIKTTDESVEDSDDAKFVPLQVLDVDEVIKSADKKVKQDAEDVADKLFAYDDKDLYDQSADADFVGADGQPLIKRLHSRLDYLERQKNSCENYYNNATESIESSTSKKFSIDIAKLRFEMGGKIQALDEMLSVPFDELKLAGLNMASIRYLKDLRRDLSRKIEVLDERLNANPAAKEVVKKLKGKLGVPQSEIDANIKDL